MTATLCTGTTAVPPRSADASRAKHSKGPSLYCSTIPQATPENVPSPLDNLAARAGSPARSNSTAGNRRPRQSRGQPHEPSGCLTGSAGASGSGLFDLSAGVSVDLQPDG